MPAGRIDHLHAFGAIIPHSGEHDRHGIGATVSNNAFQCQVRTRPVTADSWAIVKNNSAGCGNTQVVRTRTDINLAWYNNFPGLGFFDLDRRHFGQLLAELPREIPRHVLHDNDRARKIRRKFGDELYERGWTASGGSYNNDRELPCSAWAGISR